MQNIIRFPVGYKQRMINQKGNGYVPCEVSGRWIQFPETISDNGLIPIKIMTKNGETDKLICHLIIHYEDLVRAANSIRINKSE